MASSQLDAALDILKETGTEGVTQAELDRLGDELQMRQSGVVVVLRGSALMAEATVNGRTLELLVDTGASMTGLTSTRLRRLGARYLGETVRVLTAGGEIQAQVYELDELVVGGRVFEKARVLGIDSLPEGIDGILGMDVLEDVEGLLPPSSPL
jgi:clan AA aspartic protease (TIGR02281 family)